MVGTGDGRAIRCEVKSTRDDGVTAILQTMIQRHSQRVIGVVNGIDHHPHSKVRTILGYDMTSGNSGITRKQVIDLGIEDIAKIERRIVIIMAFVHGEYQAAVIGIVDMLDLTTLGERVVRLHQLETVDDQFHDAHETCHLETFGLNKADEWIHPDALAVGESTACALALDVASEQQAAEEGNKAMGLVSFDLGEELGAPLLDNTKQREEGVTYPHGGVRGSAAFVADALELCSR